MVLALASSSCTVLWACVIVEAVRVEDGVGDWGEGDDTNVREAVFTLVIGCCRNQYIPVQYT